MRIVLISYDFGEICVRLASALAQQHDVRLLLWRELAEPYLDMLDERVDFVPFNKPRLRQPLRQLFSVRWLAAKIDEFAPDVVHLQHGHLWFNGLLPRLRRRYPLVISIHDPRHHPGDTLSAKTPQRVLDFGFRQAHTIIAHNRPMRDIIHTEIGIPLDKIAITPHLSIGVDPSTIIEEEQIVLFFGRIFPYKGLDYLIKAEPYITQRLPHVKIMIAGTGEDFAKYEAMMGNRDSFIIRNEFIEDDEIPALFQRAAVVALPYIEASQSGVIATSRTYGKPVVASHVGGIPEAVDHMQTGLLVPPQDVVALADSIVQLMEDAELRHTLGANARRKAETEFSAETVARKTVAAYEQAIEHCHQPVIALEQA